MKQLTKPSVSAAIFAIGGVFAMLMRFWLLSTGVDHRGLLVISHPGCILSYAICAVLPVALFILMRKEKKALHFSLTPFSAAGYFALAIGFCLAAWNLVFTPYLAMRMATGIFGMAGAVCALIAGIYALKGSRTHPLFFCPGILFFACFLYCRYQQWSAEPELQQFVFQLLAAVLSMISLYQRAALSAHIGNNKHYLMWSRSAILVCLAAIPGSQLPLLWLAMAAFFTLDGCEETAA